MRKQILLFLLILLILSIGGYIFSSTFSRIIPQNHEAVKKQEKIKKPERVGEKIIYNVKLGKLNLGRAVFNHLSMTKLKGRDVRLVSFETRLVRFSDIERIYSDAETSLPLRVERFVSTWPFPEKITEDYDQEKFVVSIKKVKGNKEENTVIKKGTVINNAILLPYFVRDMENLKVGYNLTVNLPTQDFVIELVAEEEIKVPAGKFKAYHFTSKPKKFEIWISSDKRRIPLIIRGVNGLGYTLVMKEYNYKDSL